MLAVGDGFVAIDLGPSRLAAGIVDRDGEVVVRDRLATPARNVWPSLMQLVKRVLAANPTDAVPGWVGVTCPGPIDRGTGAMKPVGMPTWHDFPLRRELRAITGLPVDIETAGRGLALAELWHGEASLLPPAEQQFATLVLGDVAVRDRRTAGRDRSCIAIALVLTEFGKDGLTALLFGLALLIRHNILSGA